MSDVQVELNATHTVRVGATGVQGRKNSYVLIAGSGKLEETGFKISLIFFPFLVKVKTCKPALGYSFAAGTIDGVGAFNFTQGNLESGCQHGFVQMRRTQGTQQVNSNPQTFSENINMWLNLQRDAFRKVRSSLCPLQSFWRKDMWGGEWGGERVDFRAVFPIRSHYPNADEMGLSWAKAWQKPHQKREIVGIH